MRLIYILLCLTGGLLSAQPPASQIDSFRLYKQVKVTIDRPGELKKNRPLHLVFFALPNGNSTAWTMGKRLKEGDDWHYDIQHIKAQTVFIRQSLPKENFVVIYLENDFKSWPSMKSKFPDYKSMYAHIIDTVAGLFTAKHKSIYLNGHSGGGSFIFGYLAGLEKIPAQIKRISFLDSDYNYDSTYYPKLRDWLLNVKGSHLNVFAYNDSVALYNGKRVVSDSGGTWYRSRLMLRHLQKDFHFTESANDSMLVFKSDNNRVQFYLKYNLNRGIYHTQQVELNGFIHSVLCGTRRENVRVQYYGKRAYERFIEWLWSSCKSFELRALRFETVMGD